MDTFQFSDFRSKSSEVFNTVQRDGSVIIAHRNRPDMILITKEQYDKNIAMAFDDGFDASEERYN